MFITLINPAEIWVFRISTRPIKTVLPRCRIKRRLEGPFFTPFVVFRMAISKSK